MTLKRDVATGMVCIFLNVKGVLALEKAEMIGIIIGSVIGGVILIILLVVLVALLCRPLRQEKKSTSKDKKTPNLHVKSSTNHINHNRPFANGALPKGIWTTSPGIYAVNPAEAYSVYQKGGQPPPIAIPRPHTSLERAVSDPSLPKVHKGDSKGVVRPLRPPVLSGSSANSMPKNIDLLQPSGRTLERIPENDVTARAYSNFKHGQDRSNEVATAYSHYAEIKTDKDKKEAFKKSGNHLRATPSSGKIEQILTSLPNLHKQAPAVPARPLQKSQPQRSQSFYDRSAVSAIPQASGKHIVPGRLVVRSASQKPFSGTAANQSQEPKTQYAARSNKPSNVPAVYRGPDEAYGLRSHSLDRRDLHSSSNDKMQHFILPQNKDPVRGNFILKTKEKKPFINPYQSSVTVSNPALDRLRNQQQNITEHESHTNLSKSPTKRITAEQKSSIKHESPVNNPEALYAVPTKVKRSTPSSPEKPAQPSSPGILKHSQHPYDFIHSEPALNKLGNQMIVSAQIEKPPASSTQYPVRPTSISNESDMERFSVKGEKITDNAFAFLDVYLEEPESPTR